MYHLLFKIMRDDYLLLNVFNKFILIEVKNLFNLFNNYLVMSVILRSISFAFCLLFVRKVNGREVKNVKTLQSALRTHVHKQTSRLKSEAVVTFSGTFFWVDLNQLRIQRDNKQWWLRSPIDSRINHYVKFRDGIWSFDMWL